MSRKRPWRVEWAVKGATASAGEGWTISGTYSQKSFADLAKTIQQAAHGDRQYRVMKDVEFEAKS